MKLLRPGILALAFLAAGTFTSYAVAWWSMYRFDDLAPWPTVVDDLPRPYAWPMPAPDGWPSIMTLRERYESFPPAQPGAYEWRRGAIAFRGYFANDYQGTDYWMQEVRAGWPAHTASRFDHHAASSFGTPRITRNETRPWYAGLYLVDRPLLDSKGQRTPFGWPVYFPVRPVWPGLLINTAFYGTILFALALAVRRVIHSRRARAGLCLHCKYPIGTSPVCTECGKPVAHLPLIPASRLS